MAHDIVSKALKGLVVERDYQVPGRTAAAARATRASGRSIIRVASEVLQLPRTPMPVDRVTSDSVTSSCVSGRFS
jgi:hypothetical protein